MAEKPTKTDNNESLMNFFILQSEIRKVLQEGVTREEDNGSDECVHDDAFSLLGFFFVAGRSDVVVRTENKEEDRRRPREEEREVRKLGEYSLSARNVSGVGHLDPCLDNTQKDESENAVKNPSFGFFDSFLLSTGGNELEPCHYKKENRNSNDRDPYEHEHSAFDRSVPIGEIDENIASRRLNRQI